MSYLRVYAIADPTTPPAGRAYFYTDANRRPTHLDEKGVKNSLDNPAFNNYIRNSGFWFAQRQPPATLTTYTNIGGRIIAGADGWGISNETASTQYRRVDTTGAAESGLQARFWGEYTKITATGKIVAMQVIEGHNAQSLRGLTVRVQAWIKSIIGASISMKMALINWAGTVDAVPSGAGLFFSAHGANGVDPTLAANLTYLAPRAGVTPDNASAQANNILGSATTTWQRFGGVFDVPTTCRNLIVAIWSDNGVIVTNGFALSQVSLTDGYEIQKWSPGDFQNEQDRVQRFYQKTFALETGPVTNAGVATGCLRDFLGKAAATALAAQFHWRYPVRLRAAASVLTTYNPAVANAAVRQIGGTAGDLTATATANSNDQSVDITATGIATGTVGDQVGVHVTADAEL